MKQPARFAALAALALAAAAPAAFAQSEGNANARSDSAVSDPTVHEVFSRDLDNQCEYRAEVRGSVRPTSMPGSHADGTYEDDAPRYAANLRITSSLHCPGVAAVRGGAADVRGPALSGDEIARSLSERGALRVGRGAQSCAYSPEFAARDGRPQGRDVRYSCGEASGARQSRGGGVKSARNAMPTVSIFDDEPGE